MWVECYRFSIVLRPGHEVPCNGHVTESSRTVYLMRRLCFFFLLLTRTYLANTVRYTPMNMTAVPFISLWRPGLSLFKDECFSVCGNDILARMYATGTNIFLVNIAINN
jgi:hypothetical protein